ncbi:hypothetical protein G9A89_023150 [Geosiphon pyriformis]|nr:hypothetical protein G9A89_023150 [Geosiphon pyriformis]
MRHVENVYFRGALYKKPKKPAADDSVVNSSAELLSLEDLGVIGGQPMVSWDSKVRSKISSISSLSDVDNMKNTVAEETSYANSNTSAPSFDNVNNDNEAFIHSFGPIKSFALDVNLFAVPDKTNSDKLISIKKIFYKIDDFGEASTSSKFSGVIRSTFISESSLNKAKEMAINKKIIVNNDLKKINSYAVDWALVEFESTKTVCLDFVCVALAINDKELWISRNCYHALLYTLSVGTTAHNFSELVEAYSRRTCFIGCNSSSYVHNRCVIICFENGIQGVSLQWTGLSLASCTQCKQFGHITINYPLGGNSGVCDKWKKLALISCFMVFTSKTWTQVAGGSSFCVVSSSLSGNSLQSAVVPSLQFSLDMNNRFATLECSLASLAKQVDKLAKKLDALGPMVSQHELRRDQKSLVTVDTVMSEGLGAVTSGETVAEMVVYNLSVVSKLENTLDNLSKTIMGLLARLENAGLGSETLSSQ